MKTEGAEGTEEEEEEENWKEKNSKYLQDGSEEMKAEKLFVRWTWMLFLFLTASGLAGSNMMSLDEIN